MARCGVETIPTKLLRLRKFQLRLPLRLFYPCEQNSIVAPCGSPSENISGLVANALGGNE